MVRARAAGSAAAFLLGEVPLPALPTLAALAQKETRADKPEQCAVNCIDRDHRMQGHAATISTSANAGRILDGKHVSSDDAPTRARRRRRHHLGHAHRRIVQKAKQPDLARPVPTQPANPHPTPSRLHKAPMQKDPPFSSRRSPKWPSVTSVMACSSQIIQAKRVRPRQAMQADPKCVNVVAWRGRVAERSEAGWGEYRKYLLGLRSHPTPARSSSLRCDELADPPPPGEGGTEFAASSWITRASFSAMMQSLTPRRSSGAPPPACPPPA